MTCQIGSFDLEAKLGHGDLPMPNIEGIRDMLDLVGVLVLEDVWI